MEPKSGDVQATALIPLAIKAKLFAIIGKNMNNRLAVLKRRNI